MQKEAVVRLVRVGEVPGPVLVRHDLVEGRGVQFRELDVRVLAVQAFLEAVDEGFPVEPALILERAAVRSLGEVV